MLTALCIKDEYMSWPKLKKYMTCCIEQAYGLFCLYATDLGKVTDLGKIEIYFFYRQWRKKIGITVYTSGETFILCNIFMV